MSIFSFIGKIGEAVSGVAGFVVDKVVDVYHFVGGGVGQIADGAKEFFSGAYHTISGFIRDPIGTTKEAFHTVFSAGVELIGVVVDSIKEGGVEVVNIVSDYFYSIYEDVKGIFSLDGNIGLKALNLIKDIPLNAFAFLSNGAEKAIQKIASSLGDVVEIADKLFPGVKTIVDALSDKVVDAVDFTGELFSETINVVRLLTTNVAENLYNDIASHFGSNYLTDILKVVTGFFDIALQGTQFTAKAASDFLHTLNEKWFQNEGLMPQIYEENKLDTFLSVKGGLVNVMSDVEHYESSAFYADDEERGYSLRVLTAEDLDLDLAVQRAIGDEDGVVLNARLNPIGPLWKGTELLVRGKYIDDKLVGLNLNFIGTGDVADVLKYPDLLNGDAAEKYAGPLLEKMVEFAKEHGISSKDIEVTGYSYGAAIVNSLFLHRNEVAEGFYKDSYYIGKSSVFVAKPDEDSNRIFNYGAKTDPVYKLSESGDHEVAAKKIFFIDKDSSSLENTMDNVLITTDYNVEAGNSPIDGLVNFNMWRAHLSYTWEDILSSPFKNEFKVDSKIVAGNSGVVKDNEGFSTYGDGAYFIGGNRSQTIIASDNDDKIYAGGGDDIIMPGAGDDVIFGGEGGDIFTFDDSPGDKEIADFNLYEDFLRFDLDKIFSHEELVENSSQQDGDIAISYGEGSQVLLSGVSIDDLENVQLIA